ncbi:hypothetical protein BSL78_18457 [Apostichopus japonicus]|uniref:Apoptosis regulatory protein Siva n=1 Tax=Stichopus japonicus TaxID=307972 RepID=A0A2G8K9L7_STIJA|nr:hypothetical protein BSL78_18457 [Apostichopus japonicus]
MTKRQNPFDNNFCQLKTHVGEKEVNMGVDFRQRMKTVYERTMAMLFEGQRHMINPATHSSSTRDTAPSPIKPNNSPVQAADLPDWAQSQYTLDHHGNLSTQHPNISIPGSSGQPRPPPPARCSSCKFNSASAYGACSFCDQQICSQCCRECLSCQGVFCSLCSVINYDESFERCFCLSCPTDH